MMALRSAKRRREIRYAIYRRIQGFIAYFLDLTGFGPTLCQLNAKKPIRSEQLLSTAAPPKTGQTAHFAPRADIGAFLENIVIVRLNRIQDTAI
jgi:hypothetical protein